jgi:hypothetical protein
MDQQQAAQNLHAVSGFVQPAPPAPAQCFGFQPTTANYCMQPFPQEVIRRDVTRPSDGWQPVYVPATEVIKRLNLAFNFNWSFEIVSYQFVTNFYYPFALVHGRIRVPLHEQCQGGSTPQAEVVKEAFGQCMLKFDPTSRLPTDIGYDLKAAATDALKKAATLFNIGLELYEKDESAMQGLQRVGTEAQSYFPAMQQAPSSMPVEPWQIHNLRAAIQKKGWTEQYVCGVMGVQSLESMNQDQVRYAFEQCGFATRSAK